jgi:hypothetical protein
MVARIAARKRAKVVVFIPLPVEPGEEPINEMIMIRKSVAKCIEGILNVVKPELRHVIAFDREFKKAYSKP